ncbi:MAG: TonB-dependent receptor, partial [Chitinophagia bacterium]|nr:TonB-dependent receptor [Chitinophagia bacterium]
MKKLILIFIFLHYFFCYGQQQVRFTVLDRSSANALQFVLISNGHDWLGTTDSLGHAFVLKDSNIRHLVFTLTGYERLDTVINVANYSDITIYLPAQNNTLDEITVVASTRTNQAIENSPTKVEVLGAEELGEEAGIKPGNIASILGDVSGVQIQQSSAVSGNSNVRIQGLDGRYTQVLRDGMPLYEGFSGGFGILSVPPLDLKQIELIKGSASTLYGGGAIGGLVNLVSRRPTNEQQFDALINYTTLNEGNVNVFAAKRGKKIGYTFFGGYNHQQAIDVNSDGFSDLPSSGSLLLHPRLFIYPNVNTIVALGYSGTFDDRKGGDMQVLRNAGDSVHRYFEQNRSTRHTVELMAERFLPHDGRLTLKGNFSSFGRTTTTNSWQTDGLQNSFYSEASAYLHPGRLELVGGFNVTGDQYNTQAPDTATLKAFNNLTTGAFVQCGIVLAKKTHVEAGLRADVHQRYGAYLLPRIAILHRINEQWGLRAGFGSGYKTPNPLVQQTIEYNVLQLLPVASSVHPERSGGYNAEVNYKGKLGEQTEFFVNQAFFLTRIVSPVLFVPAGGDYIALTNGEKTTVSKGGDTYVRVQRNGWELYLGYTYTIARNHNTPAPNYVPLTPRHRAAFVLARDWGK